MARPTSAEWVAVPALQPLKMIENSNSTRVSDPEVWLRNAPEPGVPALLQPVAHALRQVREELAALLPGFPPACLNNRPAGLASAGFHLKHLVGVLDRLATYARAEPLTVAQLTYLKAETAPLPTTAAALAALETAFVAQVESFIQQLRATDPATLTEVRGVGRARVPSTVIGLLVHAAEHTTRHFGQLLVTVRVLGKC